MMFFKMQGLGNDYVYIDCINGKEPIDIKNLTNRLSNRHFGVGSDGLILLCKSKVADLKMRMFNSDGSEAQMCGNGIRCVAKLAYELGLICEEITTIETLSGIKTLKLNIVKGKVKTVEVDMGAPILEATKIPVSSSAKIEDKKVKAEVKVKNKKIEYKSVYSVENNSLYQVDYQNNSKVSPVENDIKLLGIIPVKTTSIIQSKPKKVSVSGESFGIKLYTDGVIIVGIRDVETDKGKCNPAKEAGLEKGDIIIEINGKKVYSADSVTDILNDNNGKDYKITVKRNGNYKEFLLKPAYSSSQGCYKVGLWVRDSTAGVGTITYYDKSNNTVSALGHPITDVDTNEIMPILDGEAVRATVTQIYKSKAGEAGSLCCEFTNDIIGTLKKNCQSGIYGKYTCTLKNTYEYEVASPNEIVR